MADAKNRLFDMSRDGARVAFILLIAWRFNDFLKYVRSNSNDKNLFIRYQGYYTGKDNKSKTSWNPMADADFQNEEELKRLFSRCLTPIGDNDDSLVTPFSDWEDFAPYLQFGILDEGEPPEDVYAKDSEAKTGKPEKDSSRKKKKQPKDREKLSGKCSKVLENAQNQISEGNLETAYRGLKTELHLLKSESQKENGKSDRFCESEILAKLATIKQLEGNNQEAISYINEALDIAKDFQSRHSQTTLLGYVRAGAKGQQKTV